MFCYICGYFNSMRKSILLIISTLLLSVTSASAQDAEYDDDDYYTPVDSLSSDTISVVDIDAKHVYALGEFGLTSYCDPTFGITIAYMETWGGYITAHTNFNFHKPLEYHINKDGFDENGKQAFLSGNKEVSRLSLVGGATYKILPKLCVYAGGGYSWRRLMFETVDGELLIVDDNSTEGWTFDFGAIANFDKLLVKLGLNTTKFKLADFRVGLGYRF